jgi:hypothetical protein
MSLINQIRAAHPLGHALRTVDDVTQNLREALEALESRNTTHAVEQIETALLALGAGDDGMATRHAARDWARDVARKEGRP